MTWIIYVVIGLLLFAIYEQDRAIRQLEYDSMISDLIINIFLQCTEMDFKAERLGGEIEDDFEE